jgi:hypothetical protein
LPQINADVVSLHLRHSFHPRNLRFPDNCSFTTDGTDARRLRTFGSTLMSFLFICAIRFIRVICGSWTTVLLPQMNTDVRRLPQINADVVSLHLRYPLHPRNLRFPDNCSF